MTLKQEHRDWEIGTVGEENKIQIRERTVSGTFRGQWEPHSTNLVGAQARTANICAVDPYLVTILNCF